MTTTTFEMKQGDLSPDLTLTFYTGDDPNDLSARVNLTGMTLTVRIRLADTGTVQTRTLTALTQSGATLGQATYAWVPSDAATITDHVGVHELEGVAVTGSKPQTFPPRGYATLQVTPKLA